MSKLFVFYIMVIRLKSTLDKYSRIHCNRTWHSGRAQTLIIRNCGHVYTVINHDPLVKDTGIEEKHMEAGSLSGTVSKSLVHYSDKSNKIYFITSLALNIQFTVGFTFMVPALFTVLDLLN